ncbi:MAG: endonuclease/exonuclease/phosphatase family protein [Rikenellaceae bacterium]
MKQKKRKTKLSIVINLALILLCIASAVVLIIGYFASTTDPRENSWIPVVGLSLHILIFLNILWLFFWILRRKVWLLIPLIALLCGVGHFGDYYQIEMTKEYGSENRSKLDTITIATYNVAGFKHLLDTDRRAQAVDSIAAYFKAQKVDVICMQEYLDNPKDSMTLYGDAFSQWPYVDFMKIVKEKKLHKGMMVMSRYPLRNMNYYKFKGAVNGFMSVDLLRAKADTITLFNCHMQSTEFNQTQPEGLTALVEREDREEAMIKVNEKLNVNFGKRAQQVDSLRYVIDSLRGRVIVAGDFNDTPNSWAVTTTRSDDLRDSFREAGSGYGYSYRPMKKLFRIDYVLYHQDYFEALEYSSPELPWSDHNPVVVKLVVKDINQE